MLQMNQNYEPEFKENNWYKLSNYDILVTLVGVYYDNRGKGGLC